MQKKQCKLCLEEKPMIEFYKHKRMADGHLNFCKKCKRDYAAKRRIINLSDSEWAKKEADRQIEKQRNRNVLFHEKVAAHNACRNMRIKTNSHLHHWSYLKEHRTDVFEMDLKTHNLIHCYMKYDQERMMYRSIETMELIDSREKAEKFYDYIIKTKS